MNSNVNNNNSNPLNAVIAEYKEQYLEEYNNNPFIQALPQIKNKEKIIKELSYRPNIDSSEIELDAEIRVHLLQRIYRFFLPLPIHIKIATTIDTLIRQGYVPRNPYNPSYKKHINMLGNKLINKDFSIEINDNFRTTASCGLIIGFSGMGKTTTVNRILNNIPQVIVHNTYKENHFNQIQVSWIKLEAPHNGSIKALTLQFFMKVDELLGTDNMKRYVSRNTSVDAMLPLMGQLANNIGLGLLVIDELQHLNKGGANQVMNYLVALMNTFGVPILLIGTPSAYDMLQREMRIARRVTGSAEIIWNNMNNDKEFEFFIKGLWKYQWVKDKGKITGDIIDAMYEKTQGVTDLVVKLFVGCQRRAIDKNIESINIELIEKVWDSEFKLLNPMVDAIRSNNPAKKLQFDDVRRVDIKSETLEKKDIVNSKLKERTIQNKELIKNEKISVSDLDDKDIRRIVLEGKKKNKTTYISLKESGLIVNIEEIIGSYND